MRKSPLWTLVDQQIAEQKYEDAFQTLARIRADASGDASGEAEATDALAQQTQLRVALGAPAEAVRFLCEQQWPETFPQRVVLELLLGYLLLGYLRDYAWEIRQRTRVDALEPADLEKMTADQLVEAAMRSYQHVWQARTELHAIPVQTLGSVVERGTYPAAVRGTLRDFVSYQAVGLLADTTHWKPEHGSDLFRLGLSTLLASQPAERETLVLHDASTHPIRRLCAVLDDLEAWHLAGGRRDAALEARLERVRRLHDAFADDDDRVVIEAHLREQLDAYGTQGWWSVGQAVLARLLRNAGRTERAHAAAAWGAGAEGALDTTGRAQCAAIAAAIRSPDLMIRAMQSDAAGRRSLEVEYKNLRQVHFRAYWLDLEKHVLGSRDYNALPSHPDWRAAWEHSQRSAGTNVSAQWTVQLPETKDFETHKVFVTPAMVEPGLYMIVASARADFAEAEGNRICGANLILSDLVLLTERDGPRLDVLVVRGQNGEPVPGAEVAFGTFDHQKGHAIEKQAITDSSGRASFTVKARAPHSVVFVLAKHGGHAAFHGESLYNIAQRPAARSELLLYTDRSIYRPGQSLHFKAILFGGKEKQGHFQVRPNAAIELQLMDANRQVVGTHVGTTNAFGSFSGSFVIPAGRMLGQWSLETKAGDALSVRVEEYKRPTFDVSIPAPDNALRLNARAEVRGEARYHFGMPVTAGTVRWTVERIPRLPPWWFWGQVDTRPRRVAAGHASLADDGSFMVQFLAHADPKKARTGISYSYVLQVEVTDEGGETRTASRTFRMGFTTVEATISLQNAFALANEPLHLSVARHDLDRVPRPGTARWRLVSVAQPAGAIPGPADLPAATPLDTEPAFRLPDDLKKPRWDRSYRPDDVMAGWPDGALVGQGQMVHDGDGDALLTLPPLAAGVYRLHYETLDERGERCTAQRTFLSVAASTPVAVPALCEVQTGSVRLGGIARVFVASGTLDQVLFLDVFVQGERVERKVLKPGDPELYEWPVDARLRGGFAVAMFAVRDFQVIRITRSVFVPWDDKELTFELATFRDRLRPGGRESWRLVLRGPDGAPLLARAAEVLAYMYDRSLEAFAKHSPVQPLSRYPVHTAARLPNVSLHPVMFYCFLTDLLVRYEPEPSYLAASFRAYSPYGVGGPGVPYGMRAMRCGAMPPPAPMAVAAAPAPRAGSAPQSLAEEAIEQEAPENAQEPEPEAPVEMRSNFAETAFFLPHLLTDDDGAVSIAFDVPDSVTEWAVWFHAITREFLSASLCRNVRSVKELMVRPYMPRFLREGDEASLRIMVNNAADHELAGVVTIRVLDADTGEDLAEAFGLSSSELPFRAEAGKSTTVAFAVRAPFQPGSVAFRVEARAGALSDGELRPLPVLPSRMHLAQSRFVTLRGNDRRVVRFDDMAAGDDGTLVHDALVVSLDAQLLYTVLKAIPYLIDYPYECCEQVLNRFVSASIVANVFRSFPSLAAMARSLAERSTQLERWDEPDPNRRMALEETPWLREAKGGEASGLPLVSLLDSDVVDTHRAKALKTLAKAQTANGGFPWFPGGQPSPFMTLYVLEGLARALEFRVQVPREMVQRAWSYLTGHFRADILPRLRRGDLPPESVSFLLYTLHAYPDASLTAGAFSEQERDELLNYAWLHWRRQAPMLKLLLSLTLHRLKRSEDASTILASVMDSAKTEPERGTFWAPEERSWLWYNDTTETHAFALRVLTEVSPSDPRRDGMALWLLLDKKLNHWKSTRATAAAIYSLVHHMQGDGFLGVRENARVTIGASVRDYIFEPDQFVGSAQWVVPGEAMDPTSCSSIAIEKTSPGFLLASATWHFSTERLPQDARGDFFHVERRFFKRVTLGEETTLRPLAEGTSVAVGDEVEVHVSIRAGHATEYVHLRDPRPSGFEPSSTTSGWRGSLGLLYYEEVRDSGANFFFEWLPVGEYTLKHRIRATMQGVFRVHPATLQAMYAPEFSAYSSGATVAVVA